MCWRRHFPEGAGIGMTTCVLVNVPGTRQVWWANSLDGPERARPRGSVRGPQRQVLHSGQLAQYRTPPCTGSPAFVEHHQQHHRWLTDCEEVQHKRVLTNTFALTGGTREFSLQVIDLAARLVRHSEFAIFPHLVAMVASVYINVKFHCVLQGKCTHTLPELLGVSEI